MDALTSDTFSMPITVTAADTDALEHVSNVKVVDWMNQAAVEHSNAVGFTLARYREVGGVFVVRRHEIDYLVSALAGDELVATTWATLNGRASAERRHEIKRARDGVVVARGFNLWAFVAFGTGRPMRIPPEVIAAFSRKA